MLARQVVYSLIPDSANADRIDRGMFKNASSLPVLKYDDLVLVEVSVVAVIVQQSFRPVSQRYHWLIINAQDVQRPVDIFKRQLIPGRVIPDPFLPGRPSIAISCCEVPDKAAVNSPCLRPANYLGDIFPQNSGGYGSGILAENFQGEQTIFIQYTYMV